jgi:membrane-associated protease RseP (regulator of RpoE activity)
MPDSNLDYFTPSFSKRQAMRPTAKTWAKHLLLFFLALFTITIAGVLPPFGLIADIFPNENPQTFSEVLSFIISLPYLYTLLIYETVRLLFTTPEYLIYGLKFSISLLFILTSHEAGHYIACRIYGVDATLPYFIPTPPLIGPAGTLGAFIKILSPLPSRSATFDIGVAGPIAGFVALIPIAILAFMTMQTAPPVQDVAATVGSGLVFSDSLLIKLLAWLFGQNLSLPIFPNPFYSAAWVGLLVTSLNLIPSGQLDGGHAIYALFGEKFHDWMSKIAFIIMVVISILGWFLYTSPSGLLFTILLGVMLRVGHPEPLDNTPLDFKRKIIAVITLIIFILSFMPFPIQVV